MSGETKSGGSGSVSFTSEELTLLLDLLENTLGETRAEVHHTHSPQWRERVLKEEAVLRGMIQKLRQSRS